MTRKHQLSDKWFKEHGWRGFHETWKGRQKEHISEEKWLDEQRLSSSGKDAKRRLGGNKNIIVGGRTGDEMTIQVGDTQRGQVGEKRNSGKWRRALGWRHYGNDPVESDVGIRVPSARGGSLRNVGVARNMFTKFPGLLTYKCSCLSGYRGKNCQIVPNVCLTLPCAHGGTCTVRNIYNIFFLYYLFK